MVLGLTGSIGMGKSTAARALLRRGAWLWDADAVVHELLGPGGAAVRPVLAAFPAVGRETPSGTAIDRKALGRIVFDDGAALRRLEAIVHPLVRRDERAFVASARRARARFVVLDIPLLFETRGGARWHASAVVSAPAFVQRARVLGRHGMTAGRLDAILRQQLGDAEKRRRADFTIPTGLGKRDSLRAIDAIGRRLAPSPSSDCRRP